MEKLASRTTDDNQAAMQSMLESFLQRLQGGAGDNLNEVARTLGNLGMRLDAMQAGLREASSRMVQSAEAMATRMGEGAEAALGRLTDQLGGWRKACEPPLTRPAPQAPRPETKWPPE